MHVQHIRNYSSCHKANLHICLFLWLALVPLIAARPGPLYPRATITKAATTKTTYPYTLTGCVPSQDPDAGKTAGVCECDNWPSPIPSQAALYSIGGCVPTMILTAPITKSSSLSETDTPKPTTMVVTLANDAVNEYWGVLPTTPNLDVPSFALTTMIRTSTSSLYSGKKMSILQSSTTSANVGTLTGMPLYTAVSDALMSACTSSGGGRDAPATGCGPHPTISSIIYTNDEGDWWDTEELALEIGPVSYTDQESLHAMVASIASTLNSSSMNKHNQWKPERPQNFGIVDGNQLPNGEEAPEQIANVVGWIQSIYTQDTAEAHDWPEQNLYVSLVNKNIAKGTFLCADGALITDSLAALALIPGLDFLAWMAAPALGVSATCDGLEHSAD